MSPRELIVEAAALEILANLVAAGSRDREHLELAKAIIAAAIYRAGQINSV
jgi:hypothetical protein